jgi:hypothetical protein
MNGPPLKGEGAPPRSARRISSPTLTPGLSRESRGRQVARAPGDGPFCWQTKAALRLIRDYFDATNNVSAARSVYLAFCEIASDEESDTYDATVAHIAKYAGLSTRTAGPLAASLGELRLINIKENKIPGTNLKGPNTYTVLPVRNGCASIRNGCVWIRNDQKQTSLPRVEESLEESPEKKETRQTVVWRVRHQKDELVAIDLYNQICGPRGWLAVNKYSTELHAALRDFIDLSNAATQTTMAAGDWRDLFEEAADERDTGKPAYNTPKGNKLIRILWENQ